MTYPEQHIQELVKTINTLRAERDEARRVACEARFQLACASYLNAVREFVVTRTKDGVCCAARDLAIE